MESKKNIRTAAANLTLTAALDALTVAVNAYNDRRACASTTAADLAALVSKAETAAAVYNRRACIESYASCETAADLVRMYTYDGKAVKFDRAHAAAATVANKTLVHSLPDYIRTGAETGKLSAAARAAASESLDLICMGVHNALATAAANDADGITSSRDSVTYDVTTVKTGLVKLAIALDIDRKACPVNAATAATVVAAVARIDRRACALSEGGKGTTAAAVFTALHGVTVKAAGKAAARAAARTAANK